MVIEAVKKAYWDLERYPLGKFSLSILIPLLLIFYLAIDYASYNNMKMFTYILFAIGIILLLIKVSWGFYYYLIVSILSDDTPRILSLTETGNFTSVHATPIGSFTIMTFWTLLMFFMLIIYSITYQKSFKMQKIDKYMIGLMLLFLVAGLIGAENLIQFPKAYISDASYVINMAVFYFFFRIVLLEEKRLSKIILLIIVCYGIKSIVGVIYYYYSIGNIQTGPNPRIIFESGRKMLPFVFFLCLSLLLSLPGMKPRYKGLLILFGSASLFHCITFGSRGGYILGIIGLLLFFLFGKYKNKRFRMKYILVPSLFICLCIISIGYTNPGALRNIGWKVKTLGNIDLNMAEFYTSHTVTTRLIEVINIFYKEVYEGSIIWGEGLGGWFNDQYYPFPFELLGAAAFSDEQILMGKLFRPHGAPTVMFLKMGLGGLFIYYFIMLLFFKQGYIIYRGIGSRYWKGVVLAILVCMPIFFYSNFMSKLQVFFGIMLGILANIQVLSITNNFKAYQDVRNASHNSLSKERGSI